MRSSDKIYIRMNNGGYDSAFYCLYQAGADCRKRYAALLERFGERFGSREPSVLISAPGRVEIGGNHTDHQRGRVIAASVDRDIICAASPRKDDIYRLFSDGFEPIASSIADLSPRETEKGNSAALVRGIAAWFERNGYKTGGFDACMSSDIPCGSGFSSSAAFEVAVGTIFNVLYNGGCIPPEEIAIAGQFAENMYFGKPCGLMDQTVCSVGGLLLIDFLNTSKPDIRRLDFDLRPHGLNLCIVNTGGDHSRLTAEYEEIFTEMRAAARHFGKECLREVSADEFIGGLPAVRRIAGDRAVLRAMHFFRENERVYKQAVALEYNDIGAFLGMVNESGRSSEFLLQNIYSPSSPGIQSLSLALALSEEILKGSGAWRVHGGGFAGTIQAYVPDSLMPEYAAVMDRVFGNGACFPVFIRKAGVFVLAADYSHST